MILVDERVGSRELLQSIRALGVQAEIAGQIDADFQFEGNGEDGTVLVGVERKAIQDMLSSMRDNRFVGVQLPRMLRIYDNTILIVEGTWRKSPQTGLVEILIGGGRWVTARGNFRASELNRFIMSLVSLAGVEYWKTYDQDDTAAVIVDRYKWYEKPWHEHKSLSKVYAPAPEMKRKGHKASFLRREPSFKDKIAAQLPGVDGRALEVAQRLPSARWIANASVEEIVDAMKGLRVGKGIAEKIVEAWREGEGD